jgi:hypothetical protein
MTSRGEPERRLESVAVSVVADVRELLRERRSAMYHQMRQRADKEREVKRGCGVAPPCRNRRGMTAVSEVSGEEFGGLGVSIK